MPSIQLNSKLLPILVFILLIVHILAPYDGWLFLLVGLSGAWIIAYWWSRSLAKGLRLRREMRFGWAQVGDRLEERFNLENHSLAPALWAEVQDYSSLPGYSISRVTGVSPNSSNVWTTSGICMRRGLFQLGPAVIRTADPLGIFSVSIPVNDRADVLVTPPIVPLPPIQVAMGGRAGDGRPRPDAPERTVSAASVRQYLPGDSLHWIHWRSSARHGDLFVRLFEGAPVGDWLIILDLYARANYGKGQDSTVEHGIILAASLADRGIRLRRPVGLVVNGKEPTWVTPQEGDGQRWDVLRSLAQAEPGECPLGDFLKRSRISLGRGASIILITADTRPDWLESLLPLLWSGATPTVLLLDPDTFTFPVSESQRIPARTMAQTLTEQGIAHTLIQRDLLDRPEARPGLHGHWEWRVSATGRAIPLAQPKDRSWKTLS